jgi:hypothetical protein
MTAKKRKQAMPRRKKEPARADQPAAKALPKPASGSPGRVDVTGVMPEGIRVDPDITEGHPGYEESGSSEIIPAERSGGGQASKGSASSGCAGGGAFGSGQ